MSLWVLLLTFHCMSPQGEDALCPYAEVHTFKSLATCKRVGKDLVDIMDAVEGYHSSITKARCVTPKMNRKIQKWLRTVDFNH